MAKAQKVLSRWLAAATPEQAKALAKAAKTSVPHLRHIAHGRRGVSADLAQRLWHASIGVTVASETDLPPLDQRTLCDACHKCPLLPRLT